MKQYALVEKAPKAPAQLYNLDKDPGETTNLYFKKSRDRQGTEDEARGIQKIRPQRADEEVKNLAGRFLG